MRAAQSGRKNIIVIAIGSRILLVAFDIDSESACILKGSDQLTLQAKQIPDHSPWTAGSVKPLRPPRGAQPWDPTLGTSSRDAPDPVLRQRVRLFFTETEKAESRKQPGNSAANRIRQRRLQVPGSERPGTYIEPQKLAGSS